MKLLVASTPVLAVDHPCQLCHPAETNSQIETSMAHALSPAPISSLLKANPHLKFTNGQTEYQIDRQGDQVIYDVRRGAEHLTLPIQWAFGVGNTGQTYVYAIGEALYEGRVSFFRSRNGLDITNGHKDFPDSTITEAAGRLLSEAEVTSCFGCHMSPAGSEFLPGVQCTACHKDLDQHASSFLSGGTPIKPAHLASLSSIEMADLCGRCHRTFSAVRDSGLRTAANVRFQPYRLVGSRCFIADDRRISCVACHNPHEEVRKNAGFYDTKCKACHPALAASTKKSTRFGVCPVAKQNCTSCHMPKIEAPEMHDTFTDHRIRVVRKGEAYPG